MGRARGWVLTAATAGAVLAWAAPAPAAPGRGDVRDVLVTDDRDERLTRTHEAASLLADRDDPERVYLSEVELQTGECRFYLSTDGGASWSESEGAPRLEPYTNCSFGSAQPQNVRTELQQGADGTIFYLFAANDPAAGGTRSVLLGRSSDRGRSFETGVVHAGPKATSPAEVEVNFVAHLAIDRDDPRRVYAMWRRSFPSVPGRERRPTRPWMAVSEDGGATFGEPFMMLDKDIGFDGPRPLVVDGRLYSFYRESAPRTPPGAPAPPTPPVTRLYSAVSTDGGRTWEETEIASVDDASEPVPLHDGEREMFYVAWHDNRNGDLDVFWSRSEDARAWSEPVRLNDDRAGNRVGQYYPQMSLGPGGRVDVAWYDFRDDPYPPPVPEEGETALGLGSNLGKTQSVYASSSSDAGVGWSPNVRVNDVGIDRTIGTWNPEYFVVVPVSISSSADGALVAWSDTRNGNADTAAQDIYSSLVSFGRAQGRGVDGGNLVAGLIGALLGAGLALSVTFVVLRRQTGAVRAASSPEAAP
ncbi:MAG: sialidase family protein [Acidimicrobiales bacterium]